MSAKLDEVDLKLKAQIAQRFKELRESSGKTQQNFAHSSGRDKQSYNRNETGKGATIYSVNKFCLENELTLKEFFDSPLFVNKQFLKK